MTVSNNAASPIEQLRLQLKESLFLDLDDYGLVEQSTGEFNSTFLGVQLNTAFQPIYDIAAGDLIGHDVYSDQKRHLFQMKPAICSSSNPPPIPDEIRHLKQS